MISTYNSTIYLAEKRVRKESSGRRVYNTILNGDDHRSGPGEFSIQEWTFAPAHSSRILKPEKRGLLLLPLVGAVNMNNWSYSPGHLVQLTNAEEAELVVGNEHPHALNNFLIIDFLLDGDRMNDNLFTTFNPNELIEKPLALPRLVTGLPFSLTVLAMNGREEREIPCGSFNENFFFVIQGAFEVAGCLIQDRDALQVKDTEQLELEALSNEAICCIIQF